MNGTSRENPVAKTTTSKSEEAPSANVTVDPATERTVKRFVAIFRNGRSAQKYITALRWAHDFLSLAIDAWDTRSLGQVLAGAVKLTAAVRQAKKIRWALLRTLVQFSYDRGRRMQGAIYVLAAVFLFRVASECLPAGARLPASSRQALLLLGLSVQLGELRWRDEDEFVASLDDDADQVVHGEGGAVERGSGRPLLLPTPGFL